MDATTKTGGCKEHKIDPARNPTSWRDRQWLALAEFALVGLIFYADHRGWIPVSKTPELFLLGWISLRLRWRDVGLTRYRPIRTRADSSSL
jgi:hypothetical protein